jgi:NhaP-type Na+/H+ or K+/H+ antiporter
MAGGGAVNTHAWWENVLSLLIVIIFALIGGLLVGGINGIKIWKLKTPPLLGPVRLPPLVAMIVGGAIARNMFAWQREAYNDMWAIYIRIVCLMVILLRGGLELSFRGKGIIVFLYTFVPQLVEATMVMLIAWLAVGMPFAIAYSLGFVVAAVSPAVLVPSMLGLAKAGYGVKKGIPTTLIAASSFDDIGAITLFGVFSTIALNGKGGKS